MRKFATATLAAAAVAVLALSACSSRGTTSPGGTPSTGSAGFPADSLIGVALPDKTSQNWVVGGEEFVKALQAAGFKEDVQFAAATNTVADQQNQIQNMITAGAKVIVIGAKDGGQLAAQVQAAHDAGIYVIAYDRMILNSPDVDYYLTFDNFAIGQLQGQALLDGMAAKYPNTKTYNIELFSGSPDDSNSAVFFDGAMDVLKPKIDDGTLTVVSGQTDIKQTATQGWLAQNAQTRMDTLLQANYSGDTVLNGVLSPNDTLARGIITSIQSAGKDVPIVTGQDSETASIPLIMQGVQYSTIYKDARAEADQTVTMIQELQQGKAVDVNNTTDYDNGSKVLQTYLLTPVLVTKDNAADAYRNDPTLYPLTQQ